MMTMKKRNFIFLMVVAILIGVLLTGCGIFYVGYAKDGFVPITRDHYEQYKLLKNRYGKLDQIHQYIDENYYTKPDEDKLEEGMYKGLVWGLGDPYSGYLTADEYEQTMISISGEYDGVGITMAADDNGYITVVSTTDDSPAAKAGIKSGDHIIKVGGKAYDSTTMEQAAAHLRGKAGTNVDVMLLRGDENLDITLTRANIITQTVKDKMLDQNIGYIRITSFEKNTSDDFKTALNKYETAGAKGLVIDLRNNGGGLVDSGVAIADMLLPKGVATYTEDRQGNKHEYKMTGDATKLPYVLLVNQGTASTSEILAAAVKDYKGGDIVGVTTFGKGIIQGVQPLKSGDAIKLTIMQYFSPKGNVINKKGVTPDYVVEPSEDGSQDPQLDKAVELLNQSK